MPSPPPAMPSPPPLLLRLAAKVARARWYAFLRQLLQHHYRQGEVSPFDSPPWLVVECVSTAVQIAAAAAAGAVAAARGDDAGWPVKTWLMGYTIANLVSLPLLLLRLRRHRRLAASLDPEAVTEGEGERGDEWDKAERAKKLLDLFSAVWFVLGNVWLLDAQQDTAQGLLHLLGTILLLWNALRYSLPFLLFLFLCCVVPLAGAAIGYDINLAADAPGASEYDLHRLPHFLFQQQAHPLLHPECCICLANYKEKEELRELPCSHQFHLDCVDQWLKIVACCPLCKHPLHR